MRGQADTSDRIQEASLTPGQNGGGSARTMDQELRNALRRNVNALRELLEQNALEQLEGTYGILATGKVQPVKQYPHLEASPELRRRREEIIAAIEHDRENLSCEDRGAAAVEKFAREAAFTLLNRLAALKLMERRKLVPECVSRGTESTGFREFREVAPLVAQSPPDGGYRLFLELLFDDVASEVRVLFDRTLPPSHIFPEPPLLKRVLEKLNDDSIAPVWDHDETLGWVYQYFTPEELRKQTRKEARSGPRNSYELSFLNQFYTPDYVVRFLAENTLGRLWWEMNRSTSLRERDFLVYRHGEEPTPREPLDPRELRILDPACGSGHFLHYCFELLQVIYREAYENDHPAGEGLRRDYPDRDAFDRAVPRLILAHNLWGIDIDLRATQITALSLYLRAKRAHADAVVRRVNAVLAAPMPGERAIFDEFLATLQGRPDAEVLEKLLGQIWSELRLAAEAGSLLKAESVIRDAIDMIRNQLPSQRELDEMPQLALDDARVVRWKQAEMRLDVPNTEEFWLRTEQEILRLLADYASGAGAGGITRQLFADDAAHGVAFLDALMQRYDVVLMNPPFGAASVPSKKYIDETYPRTKNDLYAAFVERGLELLSSGGYLGAITSRTGFFLSSYQKWREEILLRETNIIAFADLGAGVLDTAMVETAAYALQKVTES